MSNFKSAAKRKRELAKLDKRHAKEQKRALRKAERSGADVGTPSATVPAVAQPILASHRPALATASVRKPMTLAEAVQRWRNTKIAKPSKR
jgi:hypothetical protein